MIFVGFLVVMEFEFLSGCVVLVLRFVGWAVFARVGELHCGWVGCVLLLVLGDVVMVW